MKYCLEISSNCCFKNQLSKYTTSGYNITNHRYEFEDNYNFWFYKISKQTKNNVFCLLLSGDCYKISKQTKTNDVFLFFCHEILA